MGICLSKSKIGYSCEKKLKLVIQKMVQLQQEMSVLLKQREEDSKAYERERMVFKLKEETWRREQKKLNEEAKRLKRNLKEEEERIRVKSCRDSLLFVQKMREEKARQDETVNKWKMLYFAMKNELDDLIQRTHRGALHWISADQEEVMEELRHEVKMKDETIELLKAQIASMEDEDYKRKREVDILRQSLKIISSKSMLTTKTPLVKSPSKPTCFKSTKLAYVY